MAEFEVCSQPNIVIPDGREVLYGKEPFPVTVGTGEFYFVPERCNLEPRVQAVTFLALLGETNPSIKELLRMTTSSVQNDLKKSMPAFGIPSRYALPRYGFDTKLCQRTKTADGVALGERTKEVLASMSMGLSIKEMVRAHTLTKITVKSYKDYISDMMGAPGNRTRISLFGIMSDQIGSYETTTREAILAPKQDDAL